MHESKTVSKFHLAPHIPNSGSGIPSATDEHIKGWVKCKIIHST